MKILAITPSVPFPSLSGSTIIAYNHLKHLALAGHKIDLCTFRLKHQTSFADLLDYCSLRHVFPRPRRLAVLAKLGLGVFADLPISVSHFWSPGYRQRIAALCREENFDAIYCQLTEMTQFVPKALLPKTVLSIEDPLGIKHARAQSSRKGTFNRLFWKYEISRIRRFEKSISRRVGKVVLINEEDARDFRSLVGTTNVDWVDYGVNSDFFAYGDQPRDPGMILITGNMYHEPNVRGILEFARDVLPRVRSAMPHAKLWLIGASPVAEIKQLHDGENIHVTGFVDDLRTYLNRAQVSVCPVTLKIGTQTKILEAMACGTPVVTTTAGNNGIGGEHGKNILIGDQPGEMSAHIVALLRGERWTELSVASRALVTSKFSWPKNVKKLENILLCLPQK